MNFSELYFQQTPDIKEKLNKLYLSNRSFYPYDFCFSEEDITATFNQFSKATRNAYIRLLYSKCVVTESEFNEEFGAQGTEIINRGFYLFNSSSNYFMSPIEIMKVIIGSNSWPYFVSLSHKAQLLQLFPTPKPTGKVAQIIREVISSSHKCYGNINAKLDFDKGTMKLLRALWKVFGCPYSDVVKEWESVIDNLKITRPKPAYYFSITASDVQKAILPHIEGLLEKKICILRNVSGDFSLELNSLVRDRVLAVIEAEDRKVLHTEISALQEIPSAKVAMSGEQSFHIESSKLVRISVYVLARMISGALGVTQNGSLKVNDARDLAARVCASRLELPIYDTLVKALWREMTFFTHQQMQEHALKKAPLCSVEQIIERALNSDAEKLLQAVHNIRFMNYEPFGRFLSELPQEKWFDYSEIMRIFKRSPFVFHARGYHSITQDIFELLIMSAQSHEGCLDLLIKAEKPHNKVKTLSDITILGIRKVPVGNRCIVHSEFKNKLRMQSNLEVPIPPDFPLSCVFELAQILDIKDLSTLVFNDKALVFLSRKYKSMEQACDFLNKYIEGPLPTSAQRMLEKRFGSRINVHVEDSFIYVYEPKHTTQVLKVLGDNRVVRVVDDRVIVGSFFSNIAPIISKFEKHNIVITQKSEPMWLSL